MIYIIYLTAYFFNAYVPRGLFLAPTWKCTFYFKNVPFLLLWCKKHISKIELNKNYIPQKEAKVLWNSVVQLKSMICLRKNHENISFQNLWHKNEADQDLCQRLPQNSYKSNIRRCNEYLTDHMILIRIQYWLHQYSQQEFV